MTVILKLIIMICVLICCVIFFATKNEKVKTRALIIEAILVFIQYMI